MNKINVTILICLTLVGSACAKKADSSSQVNQMIQSQGLNRTWVATTNSDVLTIAYNGTLSSTICADQGSITNINPYPISSCPSGAASCGTGIISLTYTNGASGCQPAGTAQCSYVTGSNLLVFNCGNGSLTYQAL